MFNLTLKYLSQIKCDQSSSPTEAFKKFYSNSDISDFKAWLNKTIKEMPKKQNTKAESLRNEGNKLFAKGKNREAVRLYTQSLRYATYNELDYGKAMANRSAALYSLGQYEECLKDIAACFNSQYPNELRNKVQLRKLHCFYHLNMSDEFCVLVDELLETLNGNKCFEELRKKNKGIMDVPLYKNKCNEDKYGFKMNKTFAFATDLVNLCHNDKSGRHVIAARHIKTGNVLFQEKAFISSPIFTSEEDLVADTCYHCLKYVPFSSVPCESCTYCIYCSDKCKTMSWSTGHRFECPGMIMWYKIGQGLPAFKCLMKGFLSDFDEAPTDCTEFGGYIDNYPYANSLLMHFTEREDSVALIVIAMIIVVYLRDMTDFFDYAEKRCVKHNVEIETLLGGLLVKHMAQLFCNGSIVEQEQMSIAAAIYPAISMMNHSCKPNISITYDGAIATVRAAEDISKGKEIFNNYGVEWRHDRETRRAHLKNNYFFDCDCTLCLDENN